MVSFGPLGTAAMPATRTGTDVGCNDAMQRLPPVMSGGAIGSFIFADMNGDGAVDVVGQLVNGSVVAGVNDGQFNFSKSPPAVLSRDGVAVTVWDVDSDGRVDVVVWSGNGSAEVLLNNGPSHALTTFPDLSLVTARPALPTGGGVAVAIADVNNDGVRDVAIASGSGSRLWLGAVDGSFVDVSASNTAARFQTSPASCIAVGDVNSDGAIDVLVCERSGPPRMWLNTGGVSGSVFATATVVGNLSASSASFGVIDNDGDVDVLLTGNGSRLYANEGTGAYGLVLMWSANAAPVFVDVNGDGTCSCLPALQRHP